MSDRKHVKAIQAAVESMEGFTVDSIDKAKRNGHYCLTITDDEGNQFKAWHSATYSCAACRALNNFKSDVRRFSNKAKGLLDV